jgi:hypothetical integral membrane protein (TIGR02206 family)
MQEGVEFHLFGGEHLFVLLFYTVAAWWGGRYLKQHRGDNTWRHFRLLMGTLIGLNTVLGSLAASFNGAFNLSEDLPLHVCGISRILTIIYLLTPRKKLLDILYYWGVGGGLLALLIPDLKHGFPNPEFFTFFLSHGLTLFTLLGVIVVFHHQPSPTSYWTAFLTLNVVAFAIVYPLDRLLGANYMYLLHSPMVDFTPVTWLPGWPWYLLLLEGFMLLWFWICHQPLQQWGHLESPLAVKSHPR